MPFRLKKARRYEVSSKNSYVVCVYLLDNTLIECTLTAEGTGHDCVQNLAQRIGLHEPYYFGLRYVNKKLQFRWLDLDRPLKKQLDKHAHSPLHSPLLYFRVMFYIADCNFRDDVSRHHFYLQLKSDVVEGKLVCTPEQAVLLATYALQAEAGDTPDAQQIKNLTLFPRTMSGDERILAKLNQEMLTLHTKLQGVSREVAELQYVAETQQLEGYGLEYYPAKDDNGQDVLLGASFIGIFVKYLNEQPTNYFKWADINNLTHTKKSFHIETVLSERTVHFQLDEPDMVKYVFKMCSLQHKFYHSRQHVAAAEAGSAAVSEKENGSSGPLPDIQQSVQSHDAREHEQTDLVTTPSEEKWSSKPSQENHYENTEATAKVQQPSVPEVATDTPDWSPSTKPQLPSYRDAPDYETIMQQRREFMAIQQQHQPQHQDIEIVAPNLGRSQVYTRPELLAYSQPEMNHLTHNAGFVQGQAYGMYNGGHPVERTYSMVIHPTRSTPELSSLQLQPAPAPTEATIYKPPPPYPRTSNSYPDLATRQILINPSPDLISRKNVLNPGFVVQSQLAESVENLAADLAGVPKDESSVSRQTEVFFTDPPFTPQVQHAQYPSENPYENLPCSVDDALISQKEMHAEVIDPNMAENVGPLQLAALHGLAISPPPPPAQSPPQVQDKVEEGQLFLEFEQVEKRQVKRECNVGQAPQNLKRNRFKDVLPYDDSRIVLNAKEMNPNGYINASAVKLGGESYIAAQGPLPDTVIDFWHMIWEQQVEVVAMLTGIQEGKCEGYWPQTPGGSVVHGPYRISLQLTQHWDGYITSRLRIARGGKHKSLWHLQYTDWPDHGCPSQPHTFQAYLDELESVRRHCLMEGAGESTPLLVHCSAGVGRSGVLILSLALRACVQGNQPPDVPALLGTLRQQRMHMVQTLSQYAFVYSCMVHYLGSSRLI